jgi:hypothetical protein
MQNYGTALGGLLQKGKVSKKDGRTGGHNSKMVVNREWIPACAGMTTRGQVEWD